MLFDIMSSTGYFPPGLGHLKYFTKLIQIGHILDVTRCGFTKQSSNPYASSFIVFASAVADSAGAL